MSGSSKHISDALDTQDSRPRGVYQRKVFARRRRVDVQQLEALAGARFVLQPLIRAVELSPGRQSQAGDGTSVPSDDVFEMFVAARRGDMTTIRRLISRMHTLVTIEYNYTPPIHFAVRERHRETAEFLLDNGASRACDFSAKGDATGAGTTATTAFTRSARIGAGLHAPGA